MSREPLDFQTGVGLVFAIVFFVVLLSVFGHACSARKGLERRGVGAPDALSFAVESPTAFGSTMRRRSAREEARCVP